MTDETTRGHEPRDHSVERLRRWSTAPPSLTAEQAARRVRGRLPPSPRSARRWRWIAAVAVPAVVAGIVAGIWLRSSSPPHPGDPRAIEPAAVAVTDGALVVVPLRSGTVLYIAPNIAPRQGDTDEAASPDEKPEVSDDPARRGSGPGRLHSRPRS